VVRAVYAAVSAFYFNALTSFMLLEQFVYGGVLLLLSLTDTVILNLFEQIQSDKSNNLLS
jgi:hypothetical protein